MKKNKIYLGIILGVVILLGIYLYTGNNVEKTDNEIRIGGAFALSGFASSWGEIERNGAILAIEEFNNKSNGINVKLVVEDTGSNQLGTLNAVKKLIEVDKVKAIIGPTWAGTYASAIPIIKESNLMMVSQSDSVSVIKIEQNYNNIISTWPDPDDEAEKIVRNLIKNSQTEVSLIFENSAYWKVLSNKIKENALKNNISIVNEELLNVGETDFRTPIIKSKQMNSVIIFGINEEISLISFLKQRKELYSSSILYTASYITDFENNPDYEGILYNISYVYAPLFDNNFTEKYHKRFGKDPQFSASNSYDGTKILLMAIEATNSTSVDDINEFLKKNEFVTSSFGKATFDEHGGLRANNFIIKVIN